MKKTTEPKDIGEFAQDFAQGTPRRVELTELLRDRYFSGDDDKRERAEKIVREISIGPYLIYDWHIRDKKAYVMLYNGTGDTHFAYVYTLNGNEEKGQKRIHSPRKRTYHQVEESD